MIKPEDFLHQLNSAGVDFFSGVPDSLLKEFLTHLQNVVPADRHHITASEGAAVALAAGCYLASAKIPLVYMQNSGLGNAVNPLMSLTHDLVYGVPLVMLIGHRGQPGTKDEPQHKAMGASTLAMLDNLSVPYFLLTAEEKDLQAFVERTISKAREISSPVAIVVAAGSFAKAPPVVSDTVRQTNLSGSPKIISQLSRDDVVAALLAKLSGKEAIVASTGFNGRVLYEARLAAGQNEHAGDFLNVGAMGHALPIAVGLALGRPDKEVICLDGDGALLMHLGSLISAGKSGANVRHLVINNNAHESVGGQPTGAAELGFCEMARLCGYAYSHKMQADENLADVIDAFLQGDTPAFLEVPVKLGVKDNLARPSSEFQKSKNAFMQFLQE